MTRQKCLTLNAGFLHLLAVLFLLLIITPVGATEPLVLTLDPPPTTAPTVSRHLYGMNVARWDHSLYPSDSTTASLAAFPDRDQDAIAKLSACAPSFLKYPGGNDADSYLWNSPTNPPGDMDTTELLTLAGECRAHTALTVNFSESPQLAASWVQALGENRKMILFWEVGDEIWGPWTKNHMPGEAYGRRFRDFAAAIRAADPAAQLAANLGLSSSETTWTREALRSLGTSYDVVTFTYFPLNPPNETDAALFAAANQYRSLFSKLEQVVTQARSGKRPRFCLVGFNSVSTNPGPQSVSIANAIFMAQMYAALAETGTDMAAWWAFHNPNKRRGGDYGIVTADGKNTPHYTYWVYQALSQAFHGRLAGSLRAGEVELYSTHRAGDGTEAGSYTVLAINRAESASAPVQLRFVREPATGGKLLIIDESSQSRPGPLRKDLKLQKRSDGLTQTVDLGFLPPRSIAVVELPGR